MPDEIPANLMDRERADGGELALVRAQLRERGYDVERAPTAAADFITRRRDGGGRRLVRVGEGSFQVDQRDRLSFTDQWPIHFGPPIRGIDSSGGFPSPPSAYVGVRLGGDGLLYFRGS